MDYTPTPLQKQSKQQKIGALLHLFNHFFAFMSPRFSGVLSFDLCKPIILIYPTKNGLRRNTQRIYSIWVSFTNIPIFS